MHEYKERLKDVTALRLLIVGAAPFARNPTGIPFIHPDWDEMENPSCSGLYLLQSITGKCIHFLAEEQTVLNRSPTDFASLLLDHSGVGFINASYSSKTTVTEMKKWWKQVNCPIVENAARLGANILLCGEAKRIETKVSDVTARYKLVPHPDVRNTNTQEKYAEWLPWWYIGHLKLKYAIPEVPGTCVCVRAC